MAWYPTATIPLMLVASLAAAIPSVVLNCPETLYPEACEPIAVFLSAVFRDKARSPMAVLYDPTLFVCKAPAPKALFPVPSVLFQIAFKPTPTF